MDLGFETIGNATLILHDRGPVLATDPWLEGPAYFGSWSLSHEVPEEQWQNVRACRFLWISHGHPDHLSLPTLEKLRGRKILLSDHHGGRMARELAGLGFDVTVLKDGVWTGLSPRLRVCSVANYNQDAVLLIDLDGSLVVDANDAGDRGARKLLARELPRFRRSFLACLTGYGDADMINFFDEQGNRVPPAAALREPVGPQIAAVLEYYGIGWFAPSSSMHRYQRKDSVWANAYTTPLAAHAEGFVSERGRLLPAFVRFDLAAERFAPIDPKPVPEVARAPEEFGDDWSTQLTDDDVAVLRDYFGRVEHLKTFLGFLTFRVGGRDRTIDIAPGHKRGITFATPRASLMQAVEWRAFDDILIGNFCRTTLHGDWGGRAGAAALYPDFTPFVTKFGDNGGCYTPAGLRGYFEDYLGRGFTDFEPSPGDPGAAAMGRAVRRYLGTR